MATNTHLADFVKENKKLVKDYFDIRIEILRLQLIRAFAKSVGYLIWTVVSIFLLLLSLIFLFLLVGFWLAELTGSILTGFAVTLVIIIVITAVVALLRRILFVDPIVRNTIRQIEKNGQDEKDQKNGNS